ncbi:MAG TPA: hypothetical protein VLH15_11115 [Dehalococcoidales bacterium]|nr:hypothetical protein [Dehalococcoidales bacterium]
MKKGFLFFIALMVLLSATAITFARNTATTTVSISAAGASASGNVATNVSGISGVANNIKLQYSTGAAAPFTHVAPTWNPVITQPGSITAGDLYYFNSTGYAGDMLVTVYITNPSELSQNYSYLNLEINIRSGGSGAWVQSTLADGSPIGTVYLTLVNGFTSFILSGNTAYNISIDGGNYYCIDTDAAGGSLSPSFYLEVQPL